MSENNYFVPDATFGDRRETAIALTGAASEYGISQRAVKATGGGFHISEELAGIVFEDEDGSGTSEAALLATEQEEAERLAAEQAAQAEADKTKGDEPKGKTPKKTSGNRAEKTNGTNKE